MDEKEVVVIGKDLNYWWFRAKKEFVEKHIDKTKKILNIGPGVFPYNYAENFSGVASKLPYESMYFDYVILADVLEHISKREVHKSLVEIYRVLKCSGKLIITVPAHQWLFNEHDRYLEHVCRYNKKMLKYELKSAYFKLDKVRYWNSFLFFPLVIWKKFFNKGGSDFRKVNKLINFLLYKLIKAEEYIKLPFGLTLFGVFRK